MTLLVIHLGYVEFLDFVIYAMLMVVALKCFPQTPTRLFTTFYRIETMCPNCLLKVDWISFDHVLPTNTMQTFDILSMHINSSEFVHV